MTKPAACLLLAAWTLAACATGEPRWGWVHPRFEEVHSKGDLEECRKEAAQELANPFAFPGLGADYWEEKGDLVRRCMEGKGWIIEEYPP